MPDGFVPVSIFIMAPGAFFVMALLTALQNFIKDIGQKHGKDMSKVGSGCGGDCMACDKECKVVAPAAEEEKPEETVKEDKKPKKSVKEELKAEEAVKEEPKAEEPVKEEPKTEEPVKEESKAEEPVKEETKAEEPKPEGLKPEETKTDGSDKESSPEKTEETSEEDKASKPNFITVLSGRFADFKEKQSVKNTERKAAREEASKKKAEEKAELAAKKA